MEQVDWSNTLLDANVYTNILDEKYVKKVILYFVSIIMYIVSFVYLFKQKSAEYIVYVFIFIVNAIFPFTWIEDFYNFIKYNFGPFEDFFNLPHTKLLVIYRSLGIYFASLLQFLALFLVLLNNENVRKMKKATEDDNSNRPKKTGLDTGNKKTEHYDKVITIMFVTISTLIWSLIGYTFSDNKMFPAKSDYTSPLIKTIKWLLNQPFTLINNADILWQKNMNKINTTPLIKAFGMYCVVFIVVFFGAFVRIPVMRDPKKHHPMDRFHIVNMESAFPQTFERNIEDYRNLALFFFCSILSICLGIFMYLITKGFKLLANINVPSAVSKVVLGIGTIMFFSIFFAQRHNVLPDSFSVKKLIFFLLCIVFSLLGTPVVMAILQLFAEMGAISSMQKLYMFFKCMGKTDCNYTEIRTLNTNRVLSVLSCIVGIVLLFTVYGLGVDKKWVSNDSGKSFLMFNVVLVTMAISLFMALSTQYRLGSTLYKYIKSLIEFVLVYIAPLGISVFSIVQMYFAFENYKKYRKFEKMKR